MRSAFLLLTNYLRNKVLSIHLIIAFFSIIFWILPVFRQYKSDLFFYFYILALMDPFALLVGSNYGFHIMVPYHLTAIANIIIGVIFYYTFAKRKYFYIASIFSIISVLLVFFNGVVFCNIINIVVYVCIVFFFTRRALFFVAKESKVNIFHIVLILYQISLIMKILTFITIADKKNVGLLYYSITNIFEIFMAIFFAIFKEDNPKLHRVLKVNSR